MALVLDVVTAAINEGLNERKVEKEKEGEAAPKKETKGTRPRKGAVKEEQAEEAPEAVAETTEA